MYAIKKSDGSVAIMKLVNKDADPAKEVEKWHERLKKDVIGIEKIEPHQIPKDRTFRDAWGHDLKVRMPKARQIHMDRIRVARDRRLKELDIETLKGIDVQDKKQVLRDIPQNFDLTIATTPEELSALWPTELEN